MGSRSFLIIALVVVFAFLHSELSDGKEIKQRSCFPSLSPSLGAQEDLKVKSMQCAACNTDLCNAASTNVLTLGWLALLWAIRSIFAGAY
ncbi:hypothetical protein DMN91_002770 [Ooceraea biroi]|uniref:Uncharacterized protein n=1 Tax=Ooceraea biroi TaxID=2015173 RepID=A0A3L8DW63_OOCBI|nr:hypothetical protein DMN91_002770 [Ooceraea biroi]